MFAVALKRGAVAFAVAVCLCSAAAGAGARSGAGGGTIVGTSAVALGLAASARGDLDVVRVVVAGVGAVVGLIAVVPAVAGGAPLFDRFRGEVWLGLRDGLGQAGAEAGGGQDDGGQSELHFCLLVVIVV